MGGYYVVLGTVEYFEGPNEPVERSTDEPDRPAAGSHLGETDDLAARSHLGEIDDLAAGSHLGETDDLAAGSHYDEIDDPDAVRERLSWACAHLSAVRRDGVWADFKRLDGTDFAGVLDSITCLYEVVTRLRRAVHPYDLRVVVASGTIEEGLETFDVERMDGEPFYRAGRRLAELEDDPRRVEVLIDDEELGEAATDLFNVLLRLQRTNQRTLVATFEDHLHRTLQAISHPDRTSVGLPDSPGELPDSSGELPDGPEELPDDFSADLRTREVKEIPGGDIDASDHLMYAADLVRGGRLETAHAHYERALELDPDCPSANLRCGNLHLGKGQAGEATRCFERALDSYDDRGNDLGYARCLTGLGRAAHHQGDHDTARAYHERSLERKRPLEDPLIELTSLRELGTVAQAQGDYDASDEYFRECLRIEREYGHHEAQAVTLRNLGLTAHQRGDYEVAHGYFQACLELHRARGDPAGEAQSLDDLGIAASEMDADDEAERRFRAALKIDPEWVNPRRNLAELLVERGDLAEARREYERVFDLEPGDASACFEYADLSIRLDRHDEALEGLARLLETIDDGKGDRNEAAEPIRDRLGDVAEPLLENASDPERAEGILEALARYARRHSDHDETTATPTRSTKRIGHGREAGPTDVLDSEPSWE